jgi:hypothetical protein
MPAVGMLGRGRPKSACKACKSQKVCVILKRTHGHDAHLSSLQIRCSGGQPSCSHCTRLSKTCIYATSTPAVRSTQFVMDSRSSSKGSVTAPDVSKARNLYLHASAGRMSSHTGKSPSASPPAMLALPKDTLYLGISESLMYTLVEIYFEHSYNASLLLHKARFMDALARRAVEAHLILAICAFAAKYATFGHREYPRTNSY